MTTKTGAVMDQPISDPVTKAVVDNIMGNLPTKKPHVRCEDCNLSFTSQTVLDAHLGGARHAKQIKSKTILDTLEEKNVAFSKDQETSGLRCNVCNVSLNSIQQLQTHLNGNRHKKKATKGEWTGNEAIQNDPAAPKKVATNVSGPGKGVMLSCDTCNKFFNSQAQYAAHEASKKHVEKVTGQTTGAQKKKRFFPYWKKPKAAGYQDSYSQSLDNNFVAAGFVNYN